MGRIKTGWTISLKTASEWDNTVTRGKDLIPFHASELYEQSGYKYNKCHVKINKLLSIAQHVHMNDDYCTQNPLRNFGEFVSFVSLLPCHIHFFPGCAICFAQRFIMCADGSTIMFFFTVTLTIV